jgi:hypothetical protein
MTTQSTTPPSQFRFRTRAGQGLAREIARIEALASDRIKAGVAFHSVQTGALVLLRLAVETADGELVPIPVPACSIPSEPSRCTAMEEHQ